MENEIVKAIHSLETWMGVFAIGLCIVMVICTAIIVHSQE